MRKVITLLFLLVSCDLSLGKGIEETQSIYTGARYGSNYFAYGKIESGEKVTVISEGYAEPCRAEALKYPSDIYQGNATDLKLINECPNAYDILDGPLLVIKGAPVKELENLYRRALPPIEDKSKKKKILIKLKESSIESMVPQRKKRWGHTDIYPIDQPLEVYPVPTTDNVYFIRIPSAQFHPAPLYLLIGNEFFTLGDPWGWQSGIYRIDGKLTLKIRSCDHQSKDCEIKFYYVNN